MPERFNLTYVGQDGERHRPVCMLHRAIMGSLEVSAFLSNICRGHCPWLMPEQARILTVTEAGDSAEDLCARLKALGIRATLDLRNEKLEFKVRGGQTGEICTYLW